MPGGGWVTTHEDVTENRRSTDQLRAALDSFPGGISMFDANLDCVHGLGRGQRRQRLFGDRRQCVARIGGAVLAALLAASGATTPERWPLPKESGSFAIDFAAP